MLRVLKRKAKNFYHLVIGLLACWYYGYPSKKLKLIGITGTDGKTTTTHFIYDALVKSGKKAMIVSSVYAKIGDLEYDTGLHTTTPSNKQLQFFLAKAVSEKIEYAVLEVTAHAIDQNRIIGIDFQSSGITNITAEHIMSKDKESDYFSTFKKYRDTKLKLLLASQHCFINRDDSNYSYIKSFLFRHNKKFFTYGYKDETKADYKFDFKRYGLNNLPEFLKEDFSLGYSILKHLGLSDDQIAEAMKTFSRPAGRLEVVWNKQVTAIIDFAHTQNAFKTVLPYIKNNYAKNSRLIHIFGCAGQRDFAKRPHMGYYSSKNADIVILTEEDFRNEDINQIFAEIEQGIVKNGFKLADIKKIENKAGIYYKIADREQAIKLAVELSQPGDVILATGKSHEKSLARFGKEWPWDEKKTLLRFLQAKYG
ncbi:MAG: UDP-N-acetylmuramoyl-L-alanyl-D-glutamate--2,6-diaminopimelate ligase [Patescibacteria group bacterium]|nr:MAG: UDP-N-acetylmuramoyl-L-alanyl-D-glutamate--2,6-diaminopimelate ligase [Patescibacteria group bacterium]